MVLPSLNKLLTRNFLFKERNASSELQEIDIKLREIAPLGTALAQKKHQVAEEIRRLKFEINGDKKYIAYDV